MGAGNRSVLAILDSSRPAECSRCAITVFAALDHFGVPYEVLECADYWGTPPAHLRPRAAYVIAHDGAGAGLKPEVASEIAAAVRDGAGLVALDREIAAWPAALRGLVSDQAGQTQVESLTFPSAASFITWGHEQGQCVELDRPIAAAVLPHPAGHSVLVADPAGQPVAVAGQVGRGRVVVFGTGDSLYSQDVFGHVRGLDGLLWRGLVWAAAKPFATRSIPPFVTARMDDCNGAYSAFGWVEALNRHGIGPNIGLFIDELGPTDWAAVRRLYGAGGADFSMHAFRDDFYKARPDYQPYAVLADKPDLSNGGAETRFEGLSMDHTTGRDLDGPTVARNFERMDEAFAYAGIQHSRVINAHFGEIGWRAVPGFLRRGADMPCNNSVLGQLYGHQPHWRPKPYGVRGPKGRHGLVIDRCPQHPGLTFLNMSPSHLGSTHMVCDVLHGHTPFASEADRSLPDPAAQRAIGNVTLGLDSMAFGVIMTHEERIDAISLEDWETVIDETVRGLDSWDVEFAGRESVSVVCKGLFDSALVFSQAADGRMHCELCGQADTATPLSLWRNDGDACLRECVEVPPFDGFSEIDA